ncbi:MAG: GNAT family N-acetyltransferase [Balneola sp.]
MADFYIEQINPYQALSLLKKYELPTADINFDTSIFLGGFIDNKLVGVIGLELLGKLGLLRSLVVNEESRGEGIAKKLTKKLIKEAKNSSLLEVYLLATEAESFFARNGFTKVIKTEAPPLIKQTKQYSEICSDHAVVMKMDLDLA